MRVRLDCARRKRGLVVLVVLAVAAILAMLVAANAKTLHHVKGRLLILEKKQVERWRSEERGPSP